MAKNNFWMLNGWLVALLILIVFMMHFMGFLDAFKHAKVDCALGDGLDCLETYVYTENSIGISSGKTDDVVVFFVNNNMNQNLYNLSISLPNCLGINKVDSLLSNESVGYNATNCVDLKVGGFYRSEVIVRYDVIQKKKSFNVISRGYISNFVNSPKIERIDKQVNKGYLEWIKYNVG